MSRKTKPRPTIMSEMKVTTVPSVFAYDRLGHYGKPAALCYEQRERDEAKRLSLLRASQYAYEQEQRIIDEMAGHDWDSVHNLLEQKSGMSLERAKELVKFIGGK